MNDLSAVHPPCFRNESELHPALAMVPRTSRCSKLGGRGCGAEEAKRLAGVLRRDHINLPQTGIALSHATRFNLFKPQITTSYTPGLRIPKSAAPVGPFNLFWYHFRALWICSRFQKPRGKWIWTQNFQFSARLSIHRQAASAHKISKGCAERTSMMFLRMGSMHHTTSRPRRTCRLS